MSVCKLFCAVDGFCQGFEPKYHQYCLPDEHKRRNNISTNDITEAA